MFICVLWSFLMVALLMQMTIDTLFLCFCEDSERNDGSLERPYFMSAKLQEVHDVMCFSAHQSIHALSWSEFFLPHALLSLLLCVVHVKKQSREVSCQTVWEINRVNQLFSAGTFSAGESKKFFSQVGPQIRLFGCRRTLAWSLTASVPASQSFAIEVNWGLK